MSEDRDDVARVAKRISEIRRRHRPGIRWQITEHTAEIAIRAIEGAEPYRRSAKAKRRKRHKRLL